MGSVGEFEIDPEKERFLVYVERVQLFFLANDINGEHFSRYWKQSHAHYYATLSFRIPKGGKTGRY